jgi:hypothetical protein
MEMENKKKKDLKKTVKYFFGRTIIKTNRK